MNILVNASAARSSGAFNILRQFLENIPIHGYMHNYYVFIDENVNLTSVENVTFIPINTISWIKRIIWDEFGLNKWIKKTGIEPDLIISLQNTGVTYKNIPTLIYYHQSLLLSNKKWNPFLKKERLFFFYKHVYPFFVSRHLNNNTYVVVQIPSIRDSFQKKFKINNTHIHICRPKINQIDYNKIGKIQLDHKYFHFIYPATPMLYKNHLSFINILKRIYKIAPDVAKRIRIHLTFKSSDYIEFMTQIKKEKQEENFIFEGVIPYEKLLMFYKSVDALLFPSYIESFGLPLIEAAYAGVPIITADLPYTHDVIGSYEGAYFVELNNWYDWSDKILNICKCKPKFLPINKEEEDGWLKFFNIMNSLI